MSEDEMRYKKYRRLELLPELSERSGRSWSGGAGWSFIVSVEFTVLTFE
jgi:hypothetical protein